MTFSISRGKVASLSVVEESHSRNIITYFRNINVTHIYVKIIRKKLSRIILIIRLRYVQSIIGFYKISRYAVKIGRGMINQIKHIARVSKNVRFPGNKIANRAVSRWQSPAERRGFISGRRNFFLYQADASNRSVRTKVRTPLLKINDTLVLF